MQIEKISFSSTSPLKGLTADLGSVTLILGDNERGKTLFLKSLEDFLFIKKPPHVDIFGYSFSQRGDAYRLRNVLSFSSEMSRKGILDWDQELCALLYGRDTFSQEIQKNFLSSLGVDGSHAWMPLLLQRAEDLKQSIHQFLPIAKDIDYHKDSHTFEKSQEQDVASLMLKMRIGQQYLSLFDQYEETTKALDTYKQNTNPAQAEALSQEIFHLEKQVEKKRDRLEQWESGEPLNMWEGLQSLFGNVLSFMMGAAAIVSSFAMIWTARNYPTLHPLKLGALAFFAVGAIFLLKTIFSEIRRSMTEGQEGDSRQDRFMQKEQKRLIHLEEDLFEKRRVYRDAMDNLRKNLQKDRGEQLAEKCQQLSRDLKKAEEKVEFSYRTTDASLIEEEIRKNEEKLVQAGKLEDFRKEENFAKEELSAVASTGFFKLKAAFEEFQDYVHTSYVSNYCPSLSTWTLSLKEDELYQQLAELDDLTESLKKDQELSRVLSRNYRDLRSAGEDLLFRVFQHADFRRIVAYIFSGKYKNFDLGINEAGSFQVQARTGQDELIPVEKLSASASLQLYFIIKLLLAQEIVGSDGGILLMDESLALFDTIRARQFVEILGAFVRGGWQIVYALKDDQLVLETFQELFPDHVHLIDLNKEPTVLTG